MAEITTVTPAPKRRGSWLRAIAWILGALLVLLVVVYFVATSSAFFKGVILPRVGSAMNAQVTVSDASISPFSHVTLRNLKVQTTGPDPLVTAAEVRLRYSLMDIIGGKINVEEITLASPTIALVKNADGTSNLDPILQSQQSKPGEKKKEEPQKPSGGKPMQVNLKKVALTDGTIRSVTNHKDGTRDVAEVSHVNVTLDDVKNGQTGKLTLAAELSLQQTNGQMRAKARSDFTFALAQDLKPTSIQGGTRLDVTQAQGALAELAGFASAFNVELTPTEVKEVALRFQKGETPLGHLRVSGPFNPEKLEGKLSIVLAGIDKGLLNLAGAGGGMTFGGTTIGSTNEIELTKGGSLINVSGDFRINQLQVTRTNQSTPKLDLREEYQVSVDRAQSVATLTSLNLSGTQNGTPILKGGLTSPMRVPWGDTNSAVGDSTLTITLSNLDLADWKAFAGDTVPSGAVNAAVKIQSQQGGNLLSLNADARIDRLIVRAGTNQLTDGAITFQLSAKATDLKQFDLASYKLEVARDNQMLATVSGSGTYDRKAEVADIKLAAHAAPAALLQAMPQPNMNISAGTVDLDVRVAQKQKTMGVTGEFALTSFSGVFGNNDVRDLGATAAFEVALDPQQVAIRKAAGKMTQAGKPGGSFDLTGTYNLTKPSADLTARLIALNENAVGPFLQPSLGEKTLASVAINANAKIQYDPQAASSVKADLLLTNLVVKDPSGEFPATPLEAAMMLDTALQKQVLDLRQCQLALTPTARASNQVALTGQVDMTHSNAVTGNLALKANSLDFTSYYDLFLGKKPSATASAPAPKKPVPAEPTTEPEPLLLPLTNFTAQADIGKVYLHEVEITNLQAVAKINGGHVEINPFQLALNGAPVNGAVDLDLRVRGWKYGLALTAQAIPLAPLVNSFQPERQGQIGGTLSTQAKLTGAGVTGPNLQKNLAGLFDLVMTNMNLNVVNVQNGMVKVIINSVAALPEFVRNPASKVTSVIGKVTGLESKDGGLMRELQNSPLNSLTLQSTMGDGRIDLKKAVVQSAAFKADASGGHIRLAPDLTNSTLQIPVAVYLSVPLASKLSLVAADTPTNAIYSKLPDFLSVAGTAADPKANIDKLALVTTAAKSMGGSVEGLGKGVVGTVGNLLGIKSSGTNTSTTTNQPPAENVIKGLFGPKKK